MSAEDFGHYLIAQLNNGSYKGVSVLSPAGISALHHPDVPIPGSTDFYGIGWEVQHFQDVEVIRHNGASPGYTTDMILVSEKHIAVAMVMNTYSPMLGVRVARVPSSVLRMLLDQEVIPGYEFLYMRIIYALVMLIPFLHIAAIAATLRRIRSWQSSIQLPTRMQVARYITLQVIWNAAIAYALLVALPIAFEANISTVILFQPDVGWVALVSGMFALMHGVISTVIGISAFRQTVMRPAMA
jgi:CubicO group peptidase (beta-lactamase class C family)